MLRGGKMVREIGRRWEMGDGERVGKALFGRRERGGWMLWDGKGGTYIFKAEVVARKREVRMRNGVVNCMVFFRGGYLGDLVDYTDGILNL